MPARARHPFAASAILGLSLLTSSCGGSADSAGMSTASDGGPPAADDARADATVNATADATTPTPGRAASCGPSNCLGCCEQDVCFPGIDAIECGASGAACQSCSSKGQVCLGGQCATPCGPASCAGCCEANRCLAGNSQTACGKQGGACADCTMLASTCASDAGSGGACEPVGACTPATCPSGCCDANGVCQPGVDPTACGAGGASCQTCPDLESCVSQQCMCEGPCLSAKCNSVSCPSGCCDTQGVCQPGTSLSQCGKSGRFCRDCEGIGAYMQCLSQVCAPGPRCLGCLGCCDSNGQCQPGTSNSQCGLFRTCRDCTSSGSQCSSQRCTADGGACNVQTCPSGCCDENGQCQPGSASTQCGTGGAICTSCLPGFCLNQQCGSHDTDSGPPCVGCYDPSSGACVPGTADKQCGSNDAPCLDCTKYGATCDGSGLCSSPDGSVPCPQSCDGCCDANGNCQIGFADVQCGERGAACQDCTALRPTSACDFSVAPRACASRQTQCPAAYPSCPAGLQEPAPIAQKVCSANDLANAAVACSDGPSAGTCSAFFDFESKSNGACATCLQAFDADFAAQIGIRACVAPLVDASCNHNSACVVDCVTYSCYQCLDDASTAQCESQALSGTCLAYTQADGCVTQALGGPAALCNPTTYQGKFGAWLQAVGTRYCGM